MCMLTQDINLDPNDYQEAFGYAKNELQKTKNRVCQTVTNQTMPCGPDLVDQTCGFLKYFLSLSLIIFSFEIIK